MPFTQLELGLVKCLELIWYYYCIYYFMKFFTKLLVLLIIFHLPSLSFAKASYTDPAEIKQLISDYIYSGVQVSEDESMEINIGHIDPRLKLAKCTIPLELVAKGNQGISGSRMASVACNGVKPWRIYIPVSVKVSKPVVVVANTIAKGQVITAADLKLANRNIMSLNNGYFLQPEEIIGKMARHNISTGKVLNINQLQNPILVKRGQDVLIVVQKSSLKVTMKGVALKSGSKGMQIPVKNSSSKRVINATVLESGRVAAVV